MMNNLYGIHADLNCKCSVSEDITKEENKID